MYRYHQQATTARDHINNPASTSHAISSATRSTRIDCEMSLLLRSCRDRRDMATSYRWQVVVTFVRSHVVLHRSPPPGSSFVTCCRPSRDMRRRAHVKKIEKIKFDFRQVRKEFFTWLLTLQWSWFSVWELRKQLQSRVCCKRFCLDERTYVFERCCVRKLRKF